MAFAVVRLERESFIGAHTLVVERLDDGRQKTVEAKGFALVFREGRAFVQGWIVEQVHAAEADDARGVSPDDFSQRRKSPTIISQATLVQIRILICERKETEHLLA